MSYEYKKAFNLDESVDPEKEFELLDTLGKGYFVRTKPTLIDPEILEQFT
jgi:hypothetical protein